MAKMGEPEDKLVLANINELLAQELKEGETVAEYNGKIATAPGENYGSTMIALEIIVQNQDGKTRTINTFCKMLPKLEALRTAFNVKVTFFKEMEMYTKAIPAMLQLQKEHNVPEKDYVTNIFVKCFGARQGLGEKVDDDAVILMEDMRKKNFVIGDRHNGMSYEHAKLVMEKLAVFHALPIALKIKKPQVFKDEILEVAKFFIFNEDDPKKDEFNEKVVKILLSRMKKAGVDRYAEQVEKACRVSFDGTLPPLREPFSSILHNDLWVNNMLFHHEEDKPDQVVFIDFQVTQHNSPLKDVLFFIYTSLQEEVYQNHFDELINIYHKSFCHCLQQVDVDTTPFSLKAMWEEINAVAPTELNHILGMLRIITAEKEMIKDPDNFIFNEELGGQLYVEKVKSIVLVYAERKWL